MLGHTLAEKTSLPLRVEGDLAASSQVASQRNTRFLWSGLGFVVLTLIVVSARVLHQFASHPSAEPSSLDPDVAIVRSNGPEIAFVQSLFRAYPQSVRHPRPIVQADVRGPRLATAGLHASESSEEMAQESKAISQESEEIEQGLPPLKSDLNLQPADVSEITEENPLKVVIAGAGIGGLALANDLLKDPRMQVTVIERTGEFSRFFGGHIQLASNALQVMKASDEKVFDQVMEKITFTADKTNGIKDGIRDEWYAKFDLEGPAQKRGMPYTGIIEQPVLQEIYFNALPEGVVQNGDGVASYETDTEGTGVTVVTESGAKYHGDVVVGADGIWSNVRATMLNEPIKVNGSLLDFAKERDADYSGYTVFAGELNYDSYDNGEVGYKVFIGPGKYFVITDIGNRRYQWYAFLGRPADSGKTEPKPNGTVAFLKDLFAGWSMDVYHILDKTKDDEVTQRDLYDRAPSVVKPWSDGPVALVGDAVHAMLPNLNQGACQALEDSFVIAQELKSATNRGEIDEKLQTYRNRRVIRACTVSGLSRFATDFTFNGLDTPAKIVFDGGLRFENFNYAGIVTKLIQPILPIFFSIQFNFLYRGWANEAAIDYKAALGVALVGFSILIAVAGFDADVGVGVGMGVEAIFGGNNAVVLANKVAQLAELYQRTDWVGSKLFGTGLIPDWVGPSLVDTINSAP